MASKDQAQGGDKINAMRPLANSTTEKCGGPSLQHTSLPAAFIQLARLDPKSLTPHNVLHPQPGRVRYIHQTPPQSQPKR